MNRKNSFLWPRMGVEIIAIVGSILLAFAIDAWWEKRSLMELERQLLGSLQEDFLSSQQSAEFYLSGNQRVLGDLTTLLESLKSAQPGDQVKVKINWLHAAVGGPTYSPVDATLRAAHSSGSIDTLKDQSLRKSLANWRKALEDTQEDEVLVRQLVTRNIVPLLSSQIKLGEIYHQPRMLSYFKGEESSSGDEFMTLTHEPELEGAIAERVFYTSFVVTGLQEINHLQDEILRLIEINLTEN